MSKPITPGLTISTRSPGEEITEEPDDSETYPGGEDAGEVWSPEVEAILKRSGFNVSRLRKAWGNGEKLN